MKGTKWIIVLCCILVCLLMTGAAGAVPFENCTELTLGMTAEAVIENQGGYAYFSFVPEEDGTYALRTLTDESSLYSGSGYLYDADGNEIASRPNLGIGNFQLPYELTAGSQYYYRISFYNHSADVPGAIPVVIEPYQGIIQAKAVTETVFAIRPGESKLIEVAVVCSPDTQLTYEWTFREYDYETESWPESQVVEAATGNTYLVDNLTNTRAEIVCTIRDQYGHSPYIYFYPSVDNSLIAEAVGEKRLSVAPLTQLSLEVTASCQVGEISYQWYDSPNGYYTVEIPGANTPSLTTDGITSNFKGYECIVTDMFGNQKNVRFDIYLDNQLEAAAVGSDTITVVAGETAAMEVTGSCMMGELHYQWYKKRDMHWEYILIEGKTEPQYTVEAITASGRYGCLVTDDYNRGKWVYFTVNVDNQLKAWPVGNNSIYTEAGVEVPMEVGASCAVGGLSYQWSELTGYYTKENIEGAIGTSYTGTAGTSQKVYVCTVTDDYGTTAEVRFSIITNAESTWGDTTWKISPDGQTLTISGEGAISDFYNYSRSAWLAFRDTVTNVVIEEGITHIGSYAFDHFGGLTGIIIPGSVKSIGERAFNGCSSLHSLEIPANVADIDDAAFAGCSSLTLTVAAGNPKYMVSDGALYTADGQTLVECLSRSEAFTIPENVVYIAGGAFAECGNLTSITIPDHVMKIGYHAFENCANLASVTIPYSVIQIDGGAFIGCEQINDVYYDGTQDDWNAIDIRYDNECLTKANFHFAEATGKLKEPTIWLTSGGRMTGSDLEATISCPASAVTVYVEYGYMEDGRFKGSYWTEIGSNRDNSIFILGIYNQHAGTCQIRAKAMTHEAYDPDSEDDSDWAVYEFEVADADSHITPEVIFSETELHYGEPHEVTFTLPGAEAYGYFYTVMNPYTETDMGGTGWPYSGIEGNTGKLTVIGPGRIDYYFFGKYNGLWSERKLYSIMVHPAGLMDAPTVTYGGRNVGDGLIIGTEGDQTLQITCENAEYIHVNITVRNQDGEWQHFDSCGISGEQGTIDLSRFHMTSGEYGIEAWGNNYHGWLCRENKFIHLHVVDGAGYTNVLTLPAGLTTIESEAFAGLTSVDAVRIPGSVQNTADDAFSGSNVIIIAPAGSQAAEWAEAHGFECVTEEAETTANQ